MMKVIYLSVLCLLVQNVVRGVSDPRVNTVNGPIEGKNSQFDGIGFKSWLGIPYAEPPVGPMRWRSPQPSRPWNETLNAKDEKSQCVQSFGSGSEDCLYLNVYATGSGHSEKPYPVLFYISGDSLMNNAANKFDGFLAHAGNGSGVVVVESNYRLNVFGFLAIAELSEEQGVSGNYGFQDLILALKWVQVNIAGFGGDPNSVTILGQASGGTVVLALLASPLAAGLFHRAITLSGSLNVSMPLKVAEIHNDHITVESGCRMSANTSAAEVLSCLRNKTVEELIQLIPEAWNNRAKLTLPILGGSQWDGLLIVDGITIPRAVDEALALGDSSGVNHVPLLVSSMGQESDHVCLARDFCIGADLLDKDVQHMGSSEWLDFLQKYFEPWDGLLPSSSEPDTAAGSVVGSLLYQLYYSEAFHDSDANPQKAYDSIVSDFGLSCPIIDVFQRALHRSSYKSPVYVLVNQYHLSSPIGGFSRFPVKYAFQGLDASLLRESWTFDGLLEEEYVPDDVDTVAVRAMQDIVYSFMVTGQPTFSAASGGVAEKWSAFNVSSDFPYSYSVFALERDGESVKGRTVRNHNKEKCDLFKSVGISGREYWWSN